MKHLLIALILTLSTITIAQEMDSTVVEKDSIIVEEETIPATTTPTSHENKWYYGGTIDLVFGMIIHI